MPETGPPFGVVDLEVARAFHGHLGPYLVLGLRLGARIVAALQRRHFGLRVVVHCPPQPPPSCVADGLQLSTGCSLGKRNITLEPAEEVWVEAERSDGSSRLVLRSQAATMQRAAEIMAAESDVAAAQWLLSLPDEALFEVTDQT